MQQTPPSFPFGTDITVDAVIERVLGRADDHGHLIFEQTVRANDAGRYRSVTFTDETWPGQPVPLSWEPQPPRHFLLEPDPRELVYTRLRRFPCRPEAGFVLNATRRIEGTAEGGRLIGPGRTIWLYDVALPPPPGTRIARIVLAHPRDVTRAHHRIDARAS